MLFFQKIFLISRDDLQLENISLLAEISVANDRTKCMLAEILDLKCKTEDLMKTVLKFTNGKDNLDRFLTSQRYSSYKTSLGYNDFSKSNVSKKPTIFVRASKNYTHASKDYTHASFDYDSYYKNSTSNIRYSSIVQSFLGKPKSKWIWVPKTNQSGPKSPWVAIT